MTFSSKVFGKLRTITINEELYFVGKDVAKALGYKNSSEALSKHVDAEDKMQIPKQDLQEFKDVGTKGAILINESGMYSLIFSSKLESAKQFKKWVTGEVLPEIRKTGLYISEDAQDESIDFNRKFNNRRIRKTFSEADINSLEELFNQYIELSSIERTAGRLTNKDRISACKIIENTLKARHVDLLFEGAKPSQLMALQETMALVVAQRERLNNKMRGGVISNKTRRIAELEEELALMQDEENEWYLIEKHPFSNNYQYDFMQGGRVKTTAYRAWINNLHLDKYLPKTYPGLDINKPMEIHLMYGHMDKFDTINFEKSICDQISDYYGFNDRLIKRATQELHSYVDSYDEGYMYVRINNIDLGDEEDE